MKISIWHIITVLILAMGAMFGMSPNIVSYYLTIILACIAAGLSIAFICQSLQEEKQKC